MRHLLLMSVLWVMSAVTSAAQETGLVTLETGTAARGWEAVGRLDIQDKGFCTAALIDVHLILTAAHCVYDTSGELIDIGRFTFSAGLRHGRAEASRDIISLTVHPDYDHQASATHPSAIASDIAVLRLDRPIRRVRLLPYPIAGEPQRGDQVGVVSYARDRAELPSLQQICSVLGEQNGIIIMTCDVDYGASGSPVFMVRDGRTSIVSVISAMSDIEGQKVSLGTSLGAPLRQLLAHYNNIGPAKPGGTQRLVSSGQANDTGAKFVRP